MHIKSAAIPAALASGVIGISIGRASYGRVTFSRRRPVQHDGPSYVHPMVSDTPISDILNRPRMFDELGRYEPPTPSA